MYHSAVKIGAARVRRAALMGMFGGAVVFAAGATGCESGLSSTSSGPALYAVTACPDSTCAQGNSLVAIDIKEGRAVAQAWLGGANTIAYRSGALLVAGGGGTTRISIVDPTTLAVIRTQLLPWDPVAAAFSADGTVMFAAHGEGYVSRVLVADGTVTGEIQVPPADGEVGPISPVGLALDPTETFLGVTGFNGGVSNVAAIRISDQSLTLAFNWLSQPFASSNCDREAEGPGFDRAGTVLAAFDRNCGAFDVYDLATGALDQTASVLFARPYGVSSYATTIADAGGRFWAGNAGSLYRTSLTDPTQQATFTFGPTTGGLVTDGAGQTIYAFKGDPRTNGVFTVDPTSGVASQLAWNLDLIPLGAEIVTLTYGSR
jgi:DNA-binding beta-propeller fold protein YncE